MKAPATSSPPASAPDAIRPGAPLRLTVVARTPMWRGPAGWDRHWPEGETIVEGAELDAHGRETVEAMIAALENDETGNFTVAVERDDSTG